MGFEVGSHSLMNARNELEVLHRRYTALKSLPILNPFHQYLSTPITQLPRMISRLQILTPAPFDSLNPY